MTMKSATQLGPAYLRLQASRCQRLSRSCIPTKSAPQEDLRLMSEEYFAEASRMETVRPGACAAPPAVARPAPPPRGQAEGTAKAGRTA